MKKTLFLLLLSLALTSSCARYKGVDPNYKLLLQTHKELVEKYKKTDRELFKLEVGNTPVTLPPGAKITVKMPPPDPVYPEMFRNYAYEAELGVWSSFINVVGGGLTDGVFRWLYKREERKQWHDALSTRGIHIQSGRDTNLYGGIGDYGQRNFSFTPQEGDSKE